MDQTARIKSSIAKNPDASDYRIAKNLKLRVEDVAVVRGKVTKDTTLEAPIVGGVSLKGKKVLTRKPAESASKFIKRLPTGRGFSILELSRECGIGEGTVRRHAKEMGCLKYVEVEPDEWVQVVMNPETAKQYV